MVHLPQHRARNVFHIGIDLAWADKTKKKANESGIVMLSPSGIFCTLAPMRSRGNMRTVIEGIEVAAAAGLPVKVNAVVKRGVNDHGAVDMAGYFRGTGYILRFIEYMDVGATNGWCLDDVVPAAELIRAIDAVFPIRPAAPNYRGEVARRWQYVDGQGEIGFIASVTQPFCATCTRARISAEGMLYTCLFATDGTDLRTLLRAGADEEQIVRAVQRIWEARTDRYSEIRSEATVALPKVEMSYIGG